MKTVGEGIRKNHDLQKTLLRTGAFISLSLAALSGLAAAFALAPTLPALAAGLMGGVTAGSLMASSFFVHKNWVQLKKKELPDLLDHLKTAYLKFKIEQVSNSWTQRLDARKKEKPAAPEKKASAEKKASSLSEKFSGWAAAKLLKKKPPAAKPPEGPAP